MKMTIIRSTDPGPCSIIPAEILNDPRIGYEHIGLYGYWKAQGAPVRLDLGRARIVGRIGREKLGRIIRELREWGYIPKSQPVTRPRLSHREWAALRLIVFRRDGYVCVYCRYECDEPHCDHIVPVSRGGGNEIENLATACAPCNLSKGDKLLSEWEGRK